jgi:hypothetical protein
MATWSVYLRNSIGLRIFFGISFLLGANVIISKIVEKTRINSGISECDNKVQSIRAIKRLWIGMLIGFIASVAFVVTQFIARFGYFSLYQEFGAVTFGFVGAVVGGLCGIIKWRRKPNDAK